jgi:hypothetical protein
MLVSVRADFSNFPTRLTIEERLDPNAVQPPGTNTLTASGDYVFEFQNQNFIREVTHGHYVVLRTGWTRQCFVGFTIQQDGNSQ